MVRIKLTSPNSNHLYRRIAEAIQADIESNKYRSGEAIPSLRALSELYKASIPTVSRSVKLLSSKGLLKTVPGSGTYVVGQHSSKRSIEEIALVLPDVGNPFYAEIVRNIEIQCRRAGCNLILFNTFYDEEEEERCLLTLMHQGIDGVLAVPIPDSSNEVAYRKLVSASIPLVFILRRISSVDVSYVVAEEFAGICELLEHLIRIGHRKIGCIISYPPNRRKLALEAYKTVLADHEMDIRDEWVEISSQSGINGGKEAMIKMLALKERPTAVFACNDLTAIGALHVAQRLGIRVPEELAIVGVDNLEIAEFTEVPLTTVNQPRAEMGREAARILISEIRGERQLSKLALPCSLVVRESDGTLLAARQYVEESGKAWKNIEKGGGE